MNVGLCDGTPIARKALADYCWPVLLTTKQGGDSLTVCPSFGTDGHTSLKSTCHCKPKGWKAATIEKKFSVKAAPVAGDKRKKAGK